jgi:mannosyltransferase
VPSPRPSPPAEPAVASRPASARSRTLALLTLLALAALALRVVVRADRPMWFDEGFSIGLARGTWSDLWATVTNSDGNGALHSALLWGWMRATSLLAPDDLARARLFSAAAGAATVPALYAVGRSLFGPAAALAAAALLAVNQLHVYYSNEARGYALLALLVTASSWLLVRALDAPAPSLARWGAYATVAALSAYAHVFGGFSIAAQLLAALVYPSAPAEARARRRAAVLSGAAILVLLAPLLYYSAKNPGYAGWIWPLRASAVARFFERVAGDARAGDLSVWQVLLALEGACAVLGVTAAARAWRRGKLSREAWGVLFALAWVLVPVLLAVSISVVKPIFLDRYLLAVAPGWTLLAAAGAATRWRGRAYAGAIALLLALSLTGTLQPRDRDHPMAFRWDEVPPYLLARAHPDDGLVFSQAAGTVAFDHHARGHPRAGERPRLVWPLPGDPVAVRPPALAEMLEPLAARPRVWFVLFAETDESRRLRAALEERGLRRADEVAFGDIRVVLHAR